jgi:hypothetical protein
MRIINRKRFQPGPFSLGRFGPYIGVVAVSWVVVVTVRPPPQQISITGQHARHCHVSLLQGCHLSRMQVFWSLMMCSIKT